MFRRCINVLSYKENWPAEEALVIKGNTTSYEQYKLCQESTEEGNVKKYENFNFSFLITKTFYLVLKFRYYQLSKEKIFIACRVVFNILHIIYTVSCKNFED